MIDWLLFNVKSSVLQLCSLGEQAYWFSPGTPVSTTNKTDRHDIANIFLKVALNTISPKPILYVHPYITS
jgi:hypothetical protein